MKTKYTCEYCGKDFDSEQEARDCEKECVRKRDDDNWYATHKPRFSVGDLLFDSERKETFICGDIAHNTAFWDPHWNYLCYNQAFRDHLDRMEATRNLPTKCRESNLELVLPGKEYEEIIKAIEEYRDGIRGCKTSGHSQNDWDKASISLKHFGDNTTVTVRMTLTITLDDLRAFCAKQK